MAEDLLLVTRANILVVDRISTLGINPSDVERSIFEMTVEVLDEAQCPCHLDTALDGELAARFHLPSRLRATPRTDFGESSDDHNSFEIDHTVYTTQLSDICESLGGLEDLIVELEIGAWCNVHCLKNALSAAPIDGSEVGGIVSGDSTTKVALGFQLQADLGSDVRKVRQAIHSTVEIGPDGFDLSDAEEQGMHETKNVEGHLSLRRFALRSF